MNCKDIHKFVHPFIDGEFDEREEVAFSAHLTQCSACREIVAFEEAVKEKLKQTIVEAKAPQHLHERMRKRLDKEEKISRNFWGFRWYIWAPALGASAALLLVVIGLKAGSSSEKELPAIAQQSVRWHRIELPLDVKDSKGSQIQEFFRNKVPFAVKLPRINNPRARLIGARLTQLRGQQAVKLMYSIDGQGVSFFVVDPKSLPANIHERKIYWQGLRGYNVGTFVSNGTGYTVTSEMNRRGLTRLISY